MNNLYQSGEWKTEKHVPAIGAPAKAPKNTAVRIEVVVGKEMAHPNTTEHHIEWIELYFHPDGEKFPYLVGRSVLSAHGASAQGPNTSTILCDPVAVFALKTGKPGKLHAASYCNIHGLWTSTVALAVE